MELKYFFLIAGFLLTLFATLFKVYKARIDHKFQRKKSQIEALKEIDKSLQQNSIGISPKLKQELLHSELHGQPVNVLEIKFLNQNLGVYEVDYYLKKSNFFKLHENENLITISPIKMKILGKKITKKTFESLFASILSIALILFSATILVIFSSKINGTSLNFNNIFSITMSTIGFIGFIAFEILGINAASELWDSRKFVRDSKKVFGYLFHD